MVVYGVDWGRIEDAELELGDPRGPTARNSRGETYTASACSLRPSAVITLRIVSKLGVRSPERAL